MIAAPTIAKSNAGEKLSPTPVRGKLATTDVRDADQVKFSR